jgi:hypothetical protein
MVPEQTAYCKGRGLLSDTALRKGTHAKNKDRLKKQSETAKREKLHSAFNKRAVFSQNCNSERGQLAEYCQTVTVMATVLLLTVAKMYSFQATVEMGESTNHCETSVVNKKPFSNSGISVCAQCRRKTR